MALTCDLYTNFYVTLICVHLDRHRNCIREADLAAQVKDQKITGVDHFPDAGLTDILGRLMWGLGH